MSAPRAPQQPPLHYWPDEGLYSALGGNLIVVAIGAHKPTNRLDVLLLLIDATV